MKRPLRIAVIFGSTRDGRFCDHIVRWLRTELVSLDDFDVTVIDPKDRDVPWPLRQEQMMHTEAFIVVTPEYNHGYPAPLKELVDAFNAEWRAKPVAFVSYGGASGGLRAVEQLRLVFAELHAVTLRDGISLQNPWDELDASGALRVTERMRRSLATMIGRLRWWSEVLRDARIAVPYDE